MKSYDKHHLTYRSQPLLRKFSRHALSRVRTLQAP
ncbi:Uncharacterised protein [Vibrio cholerae]|nr:Uncharacterised protein [Vibrio cholerae]